MYEVKFLATCPPPLTGYAVLLALVHVIVVIIIIIIVVVVKKHKCMLSFYCCNYFTVKMSPMVFDSQH